MNLNGAVLSHKEDGTITITLPVVVGEVMGEGPTMDVAIKAAQKAQAREQEFAERAVRVHKLALASDL